MAEVWADAYNIGSGAPNFAVPSSPGRRVEFRQNHAHLATDADVVAVAVLPHVQIEPKADWAEQVQHAYASLGDRATATLHMPRSTPSEDEPVVPPKVRANWKKPPEV